MTKTENIVYYNEYHIQGTVADLDIRHFRNGECQILDPFEIP